MSILKELNPEIRKAVDADKELYQHSHAALIRNMQKATLVTDLPVGTASTLISYGDQVGMNFERDSFVLKLYQIFGK